MAYQHFRAIGQAARVGDPGESVMILLAVDDVFRAMRIDLDLPNDGLARGTLMRLFLSDPENLDVALAR